MFSKCQEKNFIVVGKTSTPLEKLHRRWKNFINVGKSSLTFKVFFMKFFQPPCNHKILRLFFIKFYRALYQNGTVKISARPLYSRWRNSPHYARPWLIQIIISDVIKPIWLEKSQIFREKWEQKILCSLKIPTWSVLMKIFWNGILNFGAKFSLE